jgi:N6-L-threonylcarbamoyladenine synthase
MNILAIETSCDDTCVAVIKAGGRSPQFIILSNIVSSQVKIHRKYGGVYPTLAKRGHQKNLPIVFKKALQRAKSPKIDLLAVTIGPGLDPCLWVGVNFAKDLAKEKKMALVPVNHIEAHILVNWLSGLKIKRLQVKEIFPAVCLVASGGHTQLILMRNFGKYKVLGETRDDAAGECFDKVARILGLGYPGGPIISKLSKKKSEKSLSVQLPRPMIHQKNYDFSFSGLKTAVLYDFKNRSQKNKRKYIKAIAKEAQKAIVDVLTQKTLKAARNFKAKSIILGGGVAANDELRKELKVLSSEYKVNFFVPEKGLCTDNAAMTAVTAYFNRLKGKKIKKRIEAKADLGI